MADDDDANAVDTSVPTDVLAQIIAMLSGQAAAADTWLTAIKQRAEAGDEAAQLALRHPWSTSETPGRATKRITKLLRRVEGELAENAPSVIGLMLYRQSLLNKLADYETTVSQSPAVSTDSLSRLSQAGVADWMINRLSAASLARLGEMTAEGAAIKAHYGAVSLAELEACGLADRVSASPNVPPIPIEPTKTFTSVNFTVSGQRTLPRHFWDGVVDFAEFKTFYRAGVVERDSARDWEDDIFLPPYRDVAEYCRFDAKFAAAMETGKFWGGVMEDWLFDDPDSEFGPPDQPWWWAEDQFDSFRRWPAYWHAFRPFGELVDALYRMNTHAWDGSDICPMLFYLLGRSYQFHTAAEKRVREFFFDFVSLPVLSYGAPAYRVLVPIDLLGKSVTTEEAIRNAPAEG